MFRSDFVWGVSASAYQVEGRDANDGCGRTIWEDFFENGGGIAGHTAETASDHIHRYEQDYSLMEQLGIKAYRFSVSWARILPKGTGEVNESGVALYRAMIWSMLRHGITPYLTLYHWELPQALQDRGGWLNPSSVKWFADYAAIVAERFSDLVENYITLNEPECTVGLGYLRGEHAPGYRLPLRETFQIAHHLLCAHGAAVRALRAHAERPIRVGYAPTCGVAIPLTDAPADVEAARKAYFSLPEASNWAWNVSWFNDPVFIGEYPGEGLRKFRNILPDFPKTDLASISEPLDFMGQNIYNGYRVYAGADGEPQWSENPRGIAKTATNWPVTPDCLYWGVRFIYERYRTPLFITENGMACHDVVSVDGHVHDPNRIHFLDAYLSALQRAVDEGADVRGYFLWTFLDNLEWNRGYGDRFGIVHVDFQTQERIVKDSAYWYREIMESNGAKLSINSRAAILKYLTPRGDIYGKA